MMFLNHSKDRCANSLLRLVRSSAHRRAKPSAILHWQALSEPVIPHSTEMHYAAPSGGRIVVGYQYGGEEHPILKSSSLYTLASSNARWLMQLAEVERFAVDDCIIFANSTDFEGWEAKDIKTTILDK